HHPRWRDTMNALTLLLAATALTSGAEPASNVKAVVNGNNQTALDLYGRLRDQPGNLFLSPYSISTALAMTYGGARGQTAAERAKALHFTLDNEQLHPAFAAIVKTLNAESKEGKKPPFALHVANALWGQKGYPFAPAFLKLTKEYYDASVRELDFAAA